MNRRNFLNLTALTAAASLTNTSANETGINSHNLINNNKLCDSTISNVLESEIDNFRMDVLNFCISNNLPLEIYIPVTPEQDQTKLSVYCMSLYGASKYGNVQHILDLEDCSFKDSKGKYTSLNIESLSVSGRYKQSYIDLKNVTGLRLESRYEVISLNEQFSLLNGVLFPKYYFSNYEKFEIQHIDNSLFGTLYLTTKFKNDNYRYAIKANNSICIALFQKEEDAKKYLVLLELGRFYEIYHQLKQLSKDKSLVEKSIK